MQARQQKRNDGLWEEERSLTKKIKHKIRRDKRNHLSEELNKNDWKQIKALRKGFSPKFVRLTNDQGQPVSSDKRPDALADYFEKHQWGRDPDTVGDDDTDKRCPDDTDDACLKLAAETKLYEEQAEIETSDHTLK